MNTRGALVCTYAYVGTHVVAGGYNRGPRKQSPKTDDFHIHKQHIYHVEIVCFGGRDGFQNIGLRSY